MRPDDEDGADRAACSVAEPRALPESALRAAPGRGPRRGRILVMDDHPMVRETMRRQLVVFGFEVELAADGEAAVAAYERARVEGRPFDLVVLDRLVEGGWGGERTLVELRRLDSGVRGLLSCAALDARPEAYLRQGFGAVLEKPYSLAELGLKLDEVLLV